MNTKSTAEDVHCEIERVEDDGRGYMCGRVSRIVWIALPDTNIPVCRACHVWLQTLESLGQKIS